MSKHKIVLTTIEKMAPSILTALIASGLGFLSLYYSPVPMIQDFGKMLTIGMIISFIVALFFLIPLLFVRDEFFFKQKENKKNDKKKSNKLEGYIYGFTKKIISFKWLIIILAIVTASLGLWADTKVRVETDVETFMPQDAKELKDILKLREIVGTTDQLAIVFEGDDVLNKETLEWIDSTSIALKNDYPDVVVQTKSINSLLLQMNPTASYSNAKQMVMAMPPEQLKLFINDDYSKGVITVGIKHLESDELDAFITDLSNDLNAQAPESLNVTVTGKAVLDVEMISALTTGRYTLTLLGIVAVFLGLLLIYRNLKKALLPLLPIILIVGWSGGAMYLFDIAYTPLTSTLGALIIGIGTEFTILIMNRFYEEKEKGNTQDVIAFTTSKIGMPILVSALTTMGGFSALIISDFAILQNFGIMTLINISLALLSTLIVMPSILSIFERKKVAS